MIRPLFITIILIILCLIMPYSWGYSWSASGSFDCDGCCVDGKQFTYTSVITNVGTDEIWVNAGKLSDSSGSTFATYGDVDSYGWSLASGETLTFSYTGQLPSPSSGSTLYYKHCIYVGSYWTGGWSCPQNYASKTVASKSNFKCYTDANCPSDKRCYIRSDCIASDCVDIMQGDCGYVSNHQWVDYECCENYDCFSGQSCVDNHCVSIPCECGYISGHECIHYECCDDNTCGSNEQCINHACQEPSCGYCEYVVNHMCSRYECCEDVECSSDEQCVNHQCQKFNCKYGEYVSGHDCLKYGCMTSEDCSLEEECRDHNCVRPQCSSDEVIKNHGCNRLGFTPFGYVKENRYVSYFSNESYQDYQGFYIAFFILIPVTIGGVIYLFRKKGSNKVPYAKKVVKGEPEKVIKEIIEEAVIKCSSCGKKVKASDEFCMFCGKKVEISKKNVEEKFEKPKEEIGKTKAKFCNKCGTKLTEGMKFCNKCGEKI